MGTLITNTQHHNASLITWFLILIFTMHGCMVRNLSFGTRVFSRGPSQKLQFRASDKLCRCSQWEAIAPFWYRLAGKWRRNFLMQKGISICLVLVGLFQASCYWLKKSSRRYMEKTLFQSGIKFLHLSSTLMPSSPLSIEKNNRNNTRVTLLWRCWTCK